ncbi:MULTISPECIES: sigma-70 family RNA polymerase sigma factor [unclassified Janthinobacterium]|uniref:sigma-70 family RNA polymerase sigma factor n=1 Tax=unclassified Janthinobacterium TaxID=2610881 RepID=UPI001795AA81|nr:MULTISPECIES: sigma-70 family RNA polymerase sigma factor [unclassified Janthinobacterium]MBB5609450.1 RNA polymerase sigma-70 factor (ECF subfamily) [Janthinobacterium sp. S3T4]MBB5614703.1 RNA polymerase sigma-70 factor (ECF subfamily) [Janthinobacterium sp. S3M3]
MTDTSLTEPSPTETSSTENDASRAAWPQLMLRAQDGDQLAYARLLKAIVPVIRALVRRKIYQDDAFVEDVVQEVLLAVHRVRHTYDPQRPFLPWLSAISSARAIDALRARGRRQCWEVYDEEAMLDHPDTSVTESHDRLAPRQQVDQLLSHLPERQRQMVELVHLSDMSLAEAAASSSMSLSAVKSVLHRAFITLRRHKDTHHD